MNILKKHHKAVTVSVVTVAGICNSVCGSVFDMPPRWRCQWRWQISVGVKARVVNWTQVDVAVWLSWNALIAHCTRRWRVHLTKYSAQTRCCLMLSGLRVGKRTCGGGRAVSPPTDLPVRSRSHRDQMTLPK